MMSLRAAGSRVRFGIVWVSWVGIWRFAVQGRRHLSTRSAVRGFAESPSFSFHPGIERGNNSRKKTSRRPAAAGLWRASCKRRKKKCHATPRDPVRSGVSPADAGLWRACCESTRRDNGPQMKADSRRWGEGARAQDERWGCGNDRLRFAKKDRRIDKLARFDESGLSGLK